MRHHGGAGTSPPVIYTSNYCVLLCTLLPLVKNNLGDITSSENYRAIAGGCLLLKLLDAVILSLEGDKLTFSELQFAYQPLTSKKYCRKIIAFSYRFFDATHGFTLFVFLSITRYLPLQKNISRDFGVIHRTLNAEESVVQDI